MASFCFGAFFKIIHFVAVAADTAWQEEIVKHADVIELEVKPRSDLNTELPDKQMKAMSGYKL